MARAPRTAPRRGSTPTPGRRTSSGGVGRCTPERAFGPRTIWHSRRCAPSPAPPTERVPWSHGDQRRREVSEHICGEHAMLGLEPSWPAACTCTRRLRSTGCRWGCCGPGSTPPRPRSAMRPAADPEHEAARGAQVVSLGRGAARLRASRPTPAPDPRGVHHGPRGRLPRPVHRTTRARPARRTAVRAKVDRVLGKDATPEGDTVSRRLFDEVRSAPARGTCTVELG